MQANLDRFVPAPPAVVFAALKRAAENEFKVKGFDDFTMTCEFTSGMSAFTYGERFSSQVIPAEGGSTLRVQAVGKVGHQFGQGSRSAKLMGQLFDDIVSIIRPA